MATGNNGKQFHRKKFVIRLLLLVIYILILSYLYYILVESGSNPIITILIILFIILMTIGLLFRKSSRSLYSKMFPDKRRDRLFEKSSSISQNKEIEQTQRKIHRPIRLSTKYYKPIVLKCRNCGNIIPNFVKQCPFCNKNVKN